jgi:sarcosine oxidase
MGVSRVTVVGSGIVGMAATLALSARGIDVVCLEAVEPGGGQSKGPVRIFRVAHATQRLTGLAQRARRGWTAWEPAVGRELIGDHGAVIVGERAEAMRRNLELAGLASEILSPQAARERAGVAVAAGESILYDPAAGNICAGAIMSYLTGATAAEREIARLEVVSGRPDGLDLMSADGVWSTDHLVVCAAEGTPALATAASPFRCATRRAGRRACSTPGGPSPSTDSSSGRAGATRSGCRATPTIRPTGSAPTRRRT